MKKQFKNEIKKLADIVVWADDWIEELKTGLTEEELEEDTGIEEFETVKKVVLESINRHAVYTNALNKDIADKAAKIELLEKEIENFTREEDDDDHGRAGFKRYIEHLIEEEERAVPDRFKERLNKEITEIFTKEKETEVNGIPCGEDAIE